MDKQKADELLISYLPKLFGFAMKKSFSYAEAEELCSEMVAELYESLLKAKEIIQPGRICPAHRGACVCQVCFGCPAPPGCFD